MPIYEFHCGGCEKDSEILVSSSDWSKTTCPHCGSKKLEKLLSVFSASVGHDGGMELPPCSGNPSACGRCDLN